MKDYIIDKKVNEFIGNYENIKELKLSYSNSLERYSLALSTTIRNEAIDKSKIENTKKIIKSNTSIFSNFRVAKVQNYLSILLSNDSYVEENFKYILSIYEKLKSNKFSNNEYLPFVAIIMYENKHKMEVDNCIEKTKYTYEFMKKYHPFLTSSEDYVLATLIAINSSNLESDLEYIEKSYKLLNEKRFYKSNNLQALSHVMSFSKDKDEESIEKVVRIKKLLEKSNCKLESNAYPLIGAISFIECDEETIVNQIKKVSDNLKDIKGFGNFSLGKGYRNMISTVIVASAYMDYLNEENNLNEISNNIFINILIAIEVAIMITIISVAVTTSSSN